MRRMADLVALSQMLRHMFGRATFRDSNFADGVGCAVGMGAESQRSYHWDGMRRGGSIDHPLITVQMTLAGWGCFQSGSLGEARPAQRVDPGQAFVCLIPSEHRYWLPEGVSVWRHAWLCFHHPYACRRIIDVLDHAGPVIPAAADAWFLAAFIRVLKGVTDGSLRERCALEHALLELALAFVHLAQRSRRPVDDQERFLEQIHAALSAEPERFLAVEDLARTCGWSRGHYTARFRAATGMSPAQAIARQRVELARQQLIASTDPIAVVARRCGFPDASHFGKVFRRFLGVAPRSVRAR
jgi:AraC-like DNA-binding protein